MRVSVIVPPTPVVTWEEADAHLRLGGDESEYLYIEGLIAAATSHIDGPDGWLGRALGVQTLEARFSEQEARHRVRLPFPPFVRLVSATFNDPAGVEQVVVDGDLEAFGSDLAPTSDAWPWTGLAPRREAIRVRYEAGYEDGIPAAIRVAILLMVGDMFRYRGTTQPGTHSAVPMAAGVADLLAPFRVYR